jgi:hypothetical protein
MMAQKMDYAESRKYTVETIRNFLDGTGGKYDWDGFISESLGYPDLDEVQQFCLKVSEMHPPEKGQGGWCNQTGIDKLRARLEDLERHSASDH